jgi:hypothetical protein
MKRIALTLIVFALTLGALIPSFALDGVPANGLQWYMNPTTGRIIGYRNPVTQHDDTVYLSGTNTVATLGAAANFLATTVSSIAITSSGAVASNAACTQGTITWDASYIYVCTATGVVKRAALTGGY